MSVNPMSEAYEAHKVELEKLQAEIERLRRKNRKLEQDHAELTMQMSNNTTNNMTFDMKEVCVVLSLAKLYVFVFVIITQTLDDIIAGSTEIAGEQIQTPKGTLQTGQSGISRGLLYAVWIPCGSYRRQQLLSVYIILFFSSITLTGLHILQ